MGFIIFIVVFSAAVIAALIVVFVLFIVKGRKGAKEDQSLYEKGMITQAQYDSGFNQGTKAVVEENYKLMREQQAAERAAARAAERAKAAAKQQEQ